ncbi:MAG: hypothetical protein A4E45_00659 [Methanosaeta sp. PtaB.Bin039]|nr:MAG: hypothetical protein A4E45_00659 [Methanosaeta sp. PtaB.Bin039]OPY45717.1 MAG: hypothetical protein A4E47_00873 [Methanosaeta sp. PtaU1.Bin028]HOT07745.1 DUF3467 domain-containing protein [Methanotrichaceae archaeon]HQF16966.1 DUF3467 domain-containing protein [Methanotrichaceae archaeon]HQI91586.1 DUF3467 domain-containing protein [Methanotrichaceae archaeon]
MTEQAKSTQLSVKIPEGLEPVYSNLISIRHSDDEVTLTFLHKIPETNMAVGRAIVAITPQHAKRLLNALKVNIQRYESVYGEIKLPEAPVMPKEDNNVEVA